MSHIAKHTIYLSPSSIIIRLFTMPACSRLCCRVASHAARHIGVFRELLRRAACESALTMYKQTTRQSPLPCVGRLAATSYDKTSMYATVHVHPATWRNAGVAAGIYLAGLPNHRYALAHLATTNIRHCSFDQRLRTSRRD